MINTLNERLNENKILSEKLVVETATNKKEAEISEDEQATVEKVEIKFSAIDKAQAEYLILEIR